MKGMRNIAPFGLRMPDELRDAVADRAKQNGRSINSEILEIISNAISEPALLQKDIEYLLSLTNPEEIEKITEEDREKIPDILIDAAIVLASRVERENSNLRKILFLLSQESLQQANKKPT